MFSKKDSNTDMERNDLDNFPSQERNKVGDSCIVIESYVSKVTCMHGVIMFKRRHLMLNRLVSGSFIVAPFSSKNVIARHKAFQWGQRLKLHFCWFVERGWCPSQQQRAYQPSWCFIFFSDNFDKTCFNYLRIFCIMSR